MPNDMRHITGRKSGKSGGGGRAPYEAPDSLLTDSTAYLIDVVSEGEIEGWADPDNPGTCIFFDDTPLQNSDGSFNFDGVEYWLRTGTPDQNPVPGFSAVESETNVGVVVEHLQPVVRSVTASDVDAVRIKVGVDALSTLDTETGDLTEATIEYAIDMSVGASGWETVATHTMSGKTTSGYQRGHRVELPDIRPVNIRVRRVTEDTETSNVQDDLAFVSYTEIIDAKLRYPDTAYVALAVSASAFGGRVPRRSYRLRGMRCWVPSNYDPETRIYDETTIWDGTFKRAFTSNPAFFTYTTLIEKRWGLGERVAPDLVDKWRIYQIGKYCDGLVPDGLGGFEPRFTINGVLNTREAAYEVITQLSATFRGVTYWGAGAIVPVQDAPADPVKIVTNANVSDGAFNYAGTGIDARKTAVVASYRHPEDHYKIKAGLAYEDHDAIARFGRRSTDTTLPLTTSRGEAMRTANWIVDTNLTSQETVTYQAGFDHAALRPGDRILISDKHRIRYRAGGRVLSISPDRRTVELDAPVAIAVNETYQLLLTTQTGEYGTFAVDTTPGPSVTSIELDAALPADIGTGCVFVLSATDLEPRLFNVISNTPDGHLFNIAALEDDATKHARVEDGINVSEDAPFVLPTSNAPDAPVGLRVQAYAVPDPGSKSKLRLLASWQSSGNPLVTQYLVRLKEPNGPWRDVERTQETSLEITPRRDDIGTYRVRVHAITLLSEVSRFSEASVENTDVFPRPAPPTGWQAESGFDTITLWGAPHPASDFKAFRIYGATAGEPTLIMLDEITTTRYTRRVGPNPAITRYAVTALNYNGDESFPTAFLEVSPSPPTVDDVAQSFRDRVNQAFDRHDDAVDNATGAVGALRDLAISSFGPLERIDGQSMLEAIRASFGELTPITRADGNVSLVEAIQVSIGPLDASISLHDRLQTEIPTLRTNDRSIDDLYERIVALDWQNYGVNKKLRDAGIIVDPSTGKVSIFGIEQTQERVSEVQIELDAAKAELAQRASVSYVNQRVDQTVSDALFDPTQIPIIAGLKADLTDVQTRLSATEGIAETLVTSLTVNDGLVTMSSVINSLNDVENKLENRVLRTDFNQQEQRVTDAQQAISAFGDAAAVRNTVTASRHITDELEALADLTVAGMWAAHDQAKETRAFIARGREDIGARIEAGDQAVVNRMLDLQAATNNSITQLIAEDTVRASETNALGESITQINVIVGGLSENLSETRDQQAAQGVALDELGVEVEETKDGLVGEARSRSFIGVRIGDVEDEADAQALDAVVEAWNRYQADRRARETIAVMFEDSRIRVQEGFSAEAAKREVLGVGLDNVRATIVKEQSTRADADAALTQSLATLSAQVQGNGDDLATVTAGLATEQSTRADADAALTQSLATLSAQVQGNGDDLVTVTAGLATEQSTRADADAALTSELNTLNAQISDPSTGLAATQAQIQTLQSTSVDANGALAAVETQISASFGSMSAMASATAFARAQADGISMGYLWRLNGEDVLELVSVSDGVSGNQVTAKLDADYVQITGIAQIDTAVIELLAADSAFISRLQVGRAQIEDTLESDDYAEDANGLPTDGIRLDFATGEIKSAGRAITRNIVLAEGTFHWSGNVTPGQSETLRFVNTGIRIGANDVWRTASRTLTAVAQITPTNALGAGSTSLWGATCEVFNGFKWFGATDWSTQGFADPWMEDPATLITPPWATGNLQRVLMNIELFAASITMNGPITINWKVYEVT